MYTYFWFVFACHNVQHNICHCVEAFLSHGMRLNFLFLSFATLLHSSARCVQFCLKTRETSSTVRVLLLGYKDKLHFSAFVCPERLQLFRPTWDCFIHIHCVWVCNQVYA